MENWLRELENLDCELEWVADLMEVVDEAYQNKRGNVKSCTFVLPTIKINELSRRATKIVEAIFEERRTRGGSEKGHPNRKE